MAATALAYMLEASPLLTVVLAWFAVRFARRGATVLRWLGRLDLAWCAVSLFAKQVAFARALSIESRPSAVWGMALAALAAPLLLKTMPSGRWRAWSAWTLVLAASLVLLTDSIYARWFDDVFPAAALFSISHLPSIAGGAWNLVTPGDVWLVADVILAAPLMVSLSRLPAAERSGRAVRLTRMAFGAVVVMAVAWRATATVRAEPSLASQRFSNLSLMAQVGPLTFHVVDGWLWLRSRAAQKMVSDEVIAETEAWLKQRQPQRAGIGPWFGVAKGMNLIVIQVESLQAPIVDLRINGREVMPNLHRLQRESLSFSQVFDQTDEGRTSDAEWVALTSLLPEPQGAAVFVNAANDLFGLPSALAWHGYRSLSAVPFTPSFWNRWFMFPRMGFATSLFDDDFAPGDTIGWGLNDREFLLEMAPRLAAQDQPFAAWLITLSLHHPFDAFPERLQRLDVGPWRNRPFGNYLHGMHYFDEGLGAFLKALERNGLLDRSVVVVTGDHAAGFPWGAELAHTLGFGNNLQNWTLAERVPLVVRVPGGGPARFDLPVGQIDFAPTMLGLLGVDAAPFPYAGRNVLGAPGSEPVVRRDGSWVDAERLFVLRGKASGTHCFDRATLGDLPIAACSAGTTLADRQVAISRRVREFDLQRHGLASPCGTPAHLLVTTRRVASRSSYP